MNLYLYSGPVMLFNICVMNHFEASTQAVSKEKARINIMYQYKKRYNKTPDAKVTLPGKIVEV